MFTFCIVMAVIVYFLFLGWVVLFFAAVKRMNHHWERVFRESNDDLLGESVRRTA